MPEPVYAYVAREIASRRRAAGLTQEALAKRVGLSRVSINNMEKRRQAVPLQRLFQVAQALQCGLHELIPNTARDVDQALDARLTALAKLSAHDLNALGLARENPDAQ